MNLLERYLQAVRKYLPSERQDDVIAELRANLLAEAEDTNAATNEDWSKLLKHHGHPFLVALRYAPQCYLIGPALYPFYRFTLKLSLQIGSVVYVLVCLALIIAGSPNQPGIIGMAIHYPVIALNIFVANTLVFAVAEWALKGRLPHLSWLKNWNPESLPPLTAQRHDSKPRLIFDFLAWFVFTLCYAAVPSFPLLLIGPPAFALMVLPIHAAPIWHDFYRLSILLMLGQLILRAVAIFGPRIPIADLLLRAAGIATLVWVVAAGQYFLPDPASHNLQMLQTINYAASITMRCVLALAALDFVWRVVRLARSSHQATSVPPSFPANSTAC